MKISSIPAILWGAYRDYLWNYSRDSWVAQASYTFRILAFLLILPILVLTLLDISAYIIARSLGIVDAAAASTSDKATVHSTQQDVPAIHVQPPAPPLSPPNNRLSPPLTTPHGYSSSDFFAHNDTSLKLSGVGVFSPASSQPPSPTLSRRDLSMHFSDSSRSSSTMTLSTDDLLRRRKHPSELTLSTVQ